MTDLVAELSDRAKGLAPEERARLAEALLASLDPGEPSVVAAWDAEIRRRLDELGAGSVDLVSADQVFSDARRSLLRRHRRSFIRKRSLNFKNRPCTTKR